jgi:hypothetical protein
MANNLATLEGYLETKLRDTTNAVWTEAELNLYLTWACARLYPTVAKEVREDVTLVDDQDQYTLTTVSDVVRVDMVNADSPNELVHHLMGGTWSWWADGDGVGGILYMNPGYASTTYDLRVHGYAPYDLVTNLPPDRYVQTILAMAAAEAVRVMMTDRAKFKQWDAISQNQNITVNEFTQMVNEGDAEYRQLLSQNRTWRRPKPATRG